jgi:hypothetical protein
VLAKQRMATDQRHHGHQHGKERLFAACLACRVG